MNINLNLSDKEGVAVLVFAAHHFGVKHVVLCPGSRNAPLTISFVRSGLFTCHSIPDERVAGYFALGLSLASGSPVVIVCTSGTAGLNLAPAVAEAAYLKVPLIVCTADRPVAWIDQGDGQTIRQEGMFANFSIDAVSIFAEPHDEDQAWYNRRMLGQIFNTISHQKQGPVHINMPLSEPLYQVKNYSMPDKPLFYKSTSPVIGLNEDDFRYFVGEFSAAEKVMILVGQMHPTNSLGELLQTISKFDNVVVLSETTSNIAGEGIISTIDRIVMPLSKTDAIRAYMPDLLITIGGMIVSKKIKAITRQYGPKAHWHIDPSDSGLDTYTHLSHEVNCHPAYFFEGLIHAVRNDDIRSDYRALWQNMAKLAEQIHLAYLDTIDFSDLKVFEKILESIPEHSMLHIANSSPIRYVQLFGNKKNIFYHANRGTSGIDGCTSTSAGWAQAEVSTSHILITGDMAFLYDSNALWNRNFPENLKIIVINNSGGGIFRIVEGSDSVDELEDFFEAHHPVDMQALANTFRIPSLLATNEEELRAALLEFFDADSSTILEVRTPHLKNASILKGYFQFISDKISTVTAI